MSPLQPPELYSNCSARQWLCRTHLRVSGVQDGSGVSDVRDGDCPAQLDNHCERSARDLLQPRESCVQRQESGAQRGGDGLVALAVVDGECAQQLSGKDARQLVGRELGRKGAVVAVHYRVQAVGARPRRLAEPASLGPSARGITHVVVLALLHSLCQCEAHVRV